jgi:hypothetical protein
MMPNTCFPPSLPPALARDGWWLDSPPPPPQTVYASGDSGHFLRGVGLLLLVALADFLFWDHALGASLALYALVVFATATLDLRPRKNLLRPALLVGLGALPVVDFVQPLSLAFMAGSLLTALVWARLPAASGAQLCAGAIEFGLRVISLVTLPLLGRQLYLTARQNSAPQAWRNWLFPLGGSLVFAALLLDANPLLAQILTFDFDKTRLFQRLLFWAGIALIVLPLLQARPPQTAPLPQLSLRWGFGITATSTLRALWMFNALIGVQSLLDLSILSGGARLPEGMSYASYAHRGAYPLLATALLAGLFALAARPYLREHRATLPLMLLWLGQNVLLSLSALLRLDLYVGALGLTYLRFYAMVWMGLVAAGLALTAWQALRAHGNDWLLKRAVALGVAVFYACSFLNIAQEIARQNLQSGNPVDWSYLCSLGPMASGPIRAASRSDAEVARSAWAYGCPRPPALAQDWRDFGFRNRRVALYLKHLPLEPAR